MPATSTRKSQFQEDFDLPLPPFAGTSISSGSESLGSRESLFYSGEFSYQDLMAAQMGRITHPILIQWQSFLRRHRQTSGDARGR